MDKKAEKKKKGKVRQLKAHIKQNKVVFGVYVILRALVILAIVLSVIDGRYENVFVCVLSLVLFLIPAFIEKNLGINLPTTLEVIILLFIFSAEILGEMSSYYIRFEWWDTMLHTLNGFLCAAAGFGLVDIINRNEGFKFELSPLYLAIVAFCFSMTIGVLWEFFEYFCDILFKTDMQKDTVINIISSTYIDPTKSNKAVVIDGIKKVVIDGNALPVDGYLDIGLYDTMKDLLVNFIGAVVFCVIGFFYVKNRGKGKFAKNFIPVINKQKGEDKK